MNDEAEKLIAHATRRSRQLRAGFELEIAALKMAHPDVEELAAGLASEAETKEARRLLGMMLGQMDAASQAEAAYHGGVLVS